MTLWHKKPRPGQLPGGLITHIDQVCFVVRDLDATLEAMTRLLGIGPFKCFTLDAPALMETTLGGQPAPWSCRLAVTLVGRTQWEVVQPLQGETLQANHLKNRYEGAQHILIDTHDSFEGVQERLAALGFPVSQSARVNLPMQLAGLTISAPAALARAVATPFGYAETHDALGTALEVARFPPGVTPPLATRLGKPEWWVPQDAKNVTARLDNSCIDHVVKLGILSNDARQTIDHWVAMGVGPWLVAEMGPSDFTSMTLPDFKATVGWCLLDDLLLEVIQPISGDTPHARLLKESGPGLHIVGVRSDTLSQAQLLEHLRAGGLPLVLEGVLHDGYEFAVVDARSAGAGWLDLVHLEAGAIWNELSRLPNLTRVGG